MSNQISDPGFARGQMLGVTLSLYETTDPNAGVGIIGTRKEFRDEDPRTGVLLSNRAVECIAVRNVSGGALLPGQVVHFRAGASGTQFSGGVLGEVVATSNTTTPSNAAAALFGIVDEYLPAAGAPNNEIFWVVVRGPSAPRKTTGAGTAISAGDQVGITSTSGLVATNATAAQQLGFAIAAAATTDTTVRLLTRTQTGF